MNKLIGTLSLLVFIIPEICFGQETDIGPGYQMMMINNPALSGSEGDGVLRMSYFNFYPGNSYNLHSVYLSYDSYFPVLHGGAGVYLTDDYLGGIINDFRGGFSYAYFLQAGKNFFINAGLTASLFHRGYNFERAVLPDQIDPLGGVSLVSSETLANKGRSVLDVGAGFLFMYGKYLGGFSIDHLAEPDLSDKGLPGERLKRKLLVHLSGDIDINKSANLKACPILFFTIQGKSASGGAGASLEAKYFTINTILLGNNGNNIDLQAGFSFQAGGVSIYYNYRFNLISGNDLIPLSLMHQTGLAFSLNKVEKRNAIKTINFPKL
jgi:type IX secretion system PorP/SprF family membrane protein